MSQTKAASLTDRGMSICTWVLALYGGQTLMTFDISARSIKSTARSGGLSMARRPAALSRAEGCCT